jgi:hypothetical protein
MEERRVLKALLHHLWLDIIVEHGVAPQKLLAGAKRVFGTSRLGCIMKRIVTRCGPPDAAGLAALEQLLRGTVRDTAGVLAAYEELLARGVRATAFYEPGYPCALITRKVKKMSEKPLLLYHAPRGLPLPRSAWLAVFTPRRATCHEPVRRLLDQAAALAADAGAALVLVHGECAAAEASMLALLHGIPVIVVAPWLWAATRRYKNLSNEFVLNL